MSFMPGDLLLLVLVLVLSVLLCRSMGYTAFVFQQACAICTVGIICAAVTEVWMSR
jgi:hypothetical protein